MKSFPSAFMEAVKKVSAERKCDLRVYEYWGVPIVAINWSTGRWLHSLQFDIREQTIGAARKREYFGGWRCIFRWAYDVIPMFPYLGRAVSVELDPLQLNEASDLYESKLRLYAQRAV